MEAQDQFFVVTEAAVPARGVYESMGSVRSRISIFLLRDKDLSGYSPLGKRGKAAASAARGISSNFSPSYQRAPSLATSLLRTSVSLWPGIVLCVPADNAFAVSQVLSWLAKERHEIPEQAERMREIPELICQLAEIDER